MRSAAGVGALVVPLGGLERSSLELGGGKAANLGEMSRAGLPVPDGFCVTTDAYTLATADAGLAESLAALAGVEADQSERLAALAAVARERILAAPVPEAVATAIARAYADMGATAPAGRADADPAGGAPVAVRSSATAEDLPFASFAGQQDTFLNVVGADALLDAVRHCWASLWTERAVAYRARNGIDHADVRLAVVVQRMVQATVAGVVFTADPLTGRRRHAAVDASAGLGEAVVSGAVTPDHYVVDRADGAVIERRMGSGRLKIESVPGGGTRRVELPGAAGAACLTDQQLGELVALAARAEALFGAPQDVEFALDAAGAFWLTQARPITTLYPLPADAPTDEAELRVYVSMNVAQGVLRPLTPMGTQAWRLAATSVARLFGAAPRDRYAGPAAIVEAGHRVFFDVTGALRTRPGRRLLEALTGVGEARTSEIIRLLADDPRLAPRAQRPGALPRGVGSATSGGACPAGSAASALPDGARAPRRGAWLRGVALFLARTRLPARAVWYLLRPPAAAASAAALCRELASGAAPPDRAWRQRTAAPLHRRELAGVALPPGDAAPAARLDAAERALLTVMPRAISTVVPAFASGLLALAAARRLLRGLASEDELEAVRRALPHNPTSEMDLALWQLAATADADAPSRAALLGCPPEHLAEEYRRGALPPVLREGLTRFLSAFGHRAVAEIDLGLPRWSEDPTHLLAVLANYLRPGARREPPDAQFRRATREAAAAVETLTRRAAGRSRPLGWLVGLLLGRGRALAGLREMPKFCFALGLAEARAHLTVVGAHLAASGRLTAADDVFFLSLPEARAALAGADLTEVVRERRASYQHEMARRRVPRVLLSDGTAPTAPEVVGPADGALRGAPASAGRIVGSVRVVLDPVGARLEPGEILVAPSTDPGWTPLFLTAGGLVMEMGGAMSHGAVVAREYGIPAVVGVAGATERLRTGDRVAVDGAAGTVEPLTEGKEEEST